MEEVDPISDLREMVLALTRERIARPPKKEPRYVAPSRKRWEASHPTTSFRATPEMHALLNEWRARADVTLGDIMKLGIERLAQLELVDVLKTRISQEESTSP